MTDDKYQYLYTYDAWNRLVKVEDQGMTPAVVAEYGYDGLNRRITRTIGSDDAIHEYYTESWQRIESRPNGESSTIGVRLFVFGIRYLDDSGAWASRPPSSFLLHANASGPPVIPAPAGIQTPSPGPAGEGRDGGALLSSLLSPLSSFLSPLTAPGASPPLTDANYNAPMIGSDAACGDLGVAGSFV